MYTLTATIEARTLTDIEDAMDEITRLANEGFTSGMNSNEGGSFTFTIEGEEEALESEDEDEPEAGEALSAASDLQAEDWDSIETVGDDFPALRRAVERHCTPEE